MAVNSNVRWEVTVNNDGRGWLTIDHSGGNGNGSFRINTTANTGANERTGTIRVATAPPNQGISRTITVTQQGVIWNSDSSDVSFWRGAINVSTQTVGSIPSYSHFPTLVTEARSAWSRALGVPIGTGTRANSQIHATGGTRREIEREYDQIFSTRWDGVAVTEWNPDSAVRITAGGRSRTVRNLRGQARLYVVYEPRFWHLDTLRQQRGNREIMYMITLHELGHALGYHGHSSNRNDVMYNRPYPPLRIHLTPTEQRHLRQIYSRFR
ncbi:MAG: hypothetical protein FWE31_06100 [Firmicutes bacterium]|nr:hypothetical protein [Bacillota bacterium]